jgi:sialate O-acetylesterase
MATQVPIGLIDVSRGGTTLETWTPIGVLQSMDSPLVKDLLATWERKIADWDPQADLANRIKRHQARVKAGKAPADAPEPSDLQPGPKMDPNRPGSCYASMLSPIAGLQVKGAVWHQGFNNAFGETTTNGVFYRQVFPQMIAAWRKAFDNPDMAFGIISLCTAGTPQDLTNFLGGFTDKGCEIREAQYQTFVDLYDAGDKNIGFASSFDQRRAWYHPQIKIPVGERIARWALATQYGVKVKWMPPRVKEMVVEDGRLVLKFDMQIGPYNDGPIYGFAIAGEDGVFHAANAIHPKTGPRSEDRAAIALSSPMVPKPLHYRYAWHRNPMGNVKTRDHTDIPVAISRSDSWTLNDIYQAYVGKPTEAPAAMNRAERGALQRALNAADMQRRVHEAKALIDAQKPKDE